MTAVLILFILAVLALAAAVHASRYPATVDADEAFAVLLVAALVLLSAACIVALSTWPDAGAQVCECVCSE